MGNESPPPSYDSVFKQLAEKKAESAGIVDYTKGAAEVYSQKTSGVFVTCLCGLFCALIGLALPIAEIVIGSLHLKACPAQSLIPIYLIVAGVFGIITGGSGFGKRMASRKTQQDLQADEENKGGAKQKAAGCCSGLFTLFTMAWLICGTVWLFKMQPCASTDNLLPNSTSVECFTKEEAFEGASFYCHRLLYDFVFYELIMKWALIGLLQFIFILICCCCCCAFCCMASKAKEAPSELAGGTNNKSYT